MRPYFRIVKRKPMAKKMFTYINFNINGILHVYYIYRLFRQSHLKSYELD